MKKIKIGIFVDGEFIPSHSGASNRFHYMSRALSKIDDIEVVVFLCDRGWSDFEKIQEESFTTYVFNPKNFYQSQDSIEKIILDEEISIIQFANLEGCVSLGIPISCKTGVKVLLEAHYDDLDFAQKLGFSQEHLEKVKNLQNLFSEYLDGIVCLSDNDKRLIAKNLDLAQDFPIFVNPSGVPDELSCISDRESKKIIFLGNMFYTPNIKAIEIISTLADKLSSSGYIFYLVGDVDKAMSDKYTKENVIFTGQVEDLESAFFGASLAVCPIFQDSGIRIKILNYTAYGIPVLTTSYGANGLPFKHGDNIYIEDDVSLWGEIIEEITNNENLYNQLKNSSKEIIENNFTWSTLSKKLSAFYKVILQNPLIHKNEILDKALLYKGIEPAWIEDVRSKGRFFGKQTSVAVDTFVKISKNEITTQRVLYKHICLEGVAGAGKSTFISQFKNDSDFICLDQPDISRTILDTKDDFKIAKEFIKVELDRARYLKENSEKKIFCDRSYISMIAFYYAKNLLENTENSQKVYDYVVGFFKKNHDYSKFDSIFIFTTSVAASLERRARYNSEIYYPWFSEGFLAAMLDFYLSEKYKDFIEEGDNTKIYTLDTTDMSVEEVRSYFLKFI